MELALIAPTKFLSTLCGPLEVQMALAHKVLEDEEYRHFYCSLGGPRRIIMDNSLIELGGAVDVNQLIEAAYMIQPLEVIIPDVFRNKDETIRTFLEVMEQADRFPWVCHFAVAHGRNQTEWVECFDFFNTHPDVNTIGIPKVLDEIWEPGGRLGATAFLEATNRPRPDKNYHLLGVWTDPLEVLLQSRHSWIRSVDTALPIHAGMAGIHFGPMGLNGIDKPKRPHRYFPAEDLRYPDIVETNIKILRDWAGGIAW